jgi:hypothetical protein
MTTTIPTPAQLLTSAAGSQELRTAIDRYLEARTEFEKTWYPHGDTDWEYSLATESAIYVMVATGAADTDDAAFAALEALFAEAGES